MEPIAREEYSMREGVTVVQVGFVIHPRILRSGASPDGIVKGLRGVEFKCPTLETHLDYLFAGVLPKEYEPQVMWNLACCPELPEWDFVSYCDEGLPEEMQQFKVTVPRNEERIAQLEEGVLKTLADVDEMLAKLRADNPRSSLKERLRQSVAAEPFVSSGNFETDMRAVADSLVGDERVLRA